MATASKRVLVTGAAVKVAQPLAGVPACAGTRSQAAPRGSLEASRLPSKIGRAWGTPVLRDLNAAAPRGRATGHRIRRSTWSRAARSRPHSELAHSASKTCKRSPNVLSMPRRTTARSRRAAGRGRSRLRTGAMLTARHWGRAARSRGAAGRGRSRGSLTALQKQHNGTQMLLPNSARKVTELLRVRTGQR